jgi:S-adenosylmethionine hydrolase
VLWVDRFGNLQLNVDPDDLDGWGERIELTIEERRRTARRVGTFADVGVGNIGLLVDSYGLLAVVADRSSAAEELRAAAGDPVTLVRLEDQDDRPAPTAVRLGRKSDGPTTDPREAR